MQQAAAQSPSVAGELMTIEDVFSIKGRGTVATGKVLAPIHVGRSVVVRGASGDVATTVTSIETFRRTSDSANPGDNAGILLSGVDGNQIQRGDKIISA